MPNHVHLLIETPLPNLGQGMKGLQGRYTQAFNARHGRSGHVFQGRFGAERVKGDRQLTAVARYIEENPVKAGLCNRPRDWPWSAVSALYEGMCPTWLNDQRLQTLLGTVVG